MKNITEIDQYMALRPVPAEGFAYHAPFEPGFRLAGMAFDTSADKPFRRLPVSPVGEDIINENVNILADHTAGLRIAFRSNSRKVIVRAKLANGDILHHMPLTGSSSFDLYVGGPGAWRAVGAAAFMPHKTEFRALLFDRQEEGEREYLLHFPLYNGVHELWIGLEESAWIKPPTSWSSDSPVVVYGTSITQGGCASRPGMAWTNILSRWRNRDFINLGFSGNGKGETEMAEYLANISNAGAFILDYEANAHLNGLKKTLKNFLAILRSTHPKTPIFIISALPIKFQIAFGANDNTAEKYPERSESRAWQEQFVNEQRFAGDKNLYFIDGNELLGNDWDECMPDGCHLNDLGFYRLAEALNRLLNC